MAKRVSVQMIETHVHWEDFEVDDLPSDWEDLSAFEQWHWLQAFGEYKGSESELVEVDEVSWVVVED